MGVGTRPLDVCSISKNPSSMSLAISFLTVAAEHRNLYFVTKTWDPTGSDDSMYSLIIVFKSWICLSVSICYQYDNMSANVVKNNPKL